MQKTAGRYLLILITSLLFLSMLGCSQSRVTQVNLKSLQIAPLLSSLSAGAEIQLFATAFYDNGSRKDATDDVTWSSSNSAIVKVSKEGRVQSISPGQATITATLESSTTRELKSHSIQLTVSGAKLLSLNINPANPRIYVGTNVDLSVFGLYDDGTKIDLTDSISWQTGSTAFFNLENNRVLGTNDGSNTVSASFDNISTSTEITVINASLKKIIFDLGSATFYAGNDIKLQATGIFSDGNKQDISELVKWSYTAPSSLTVNQNDNIISVDAAGELTVTASLNNISASQTITISPATLKSLQVFSSQTSVSAGKQIDFQAIGEYTDNNKIDLTSLVNWDSSNNNIVDISNAIGFEGQAFTKSTGKATITATMGNISGNIDVNVTTATLDKIDITLQRQDVAKGTSLVLVATGIYSDNTSRDLTQLVTWSSEDVNIIHVNNETGKSGVATGINTGTSKIFASLDGVTASAEVTVTAATLVDIFIDTPSNTIVNGSELKLQAVGIFSDGNKQVLTDQVSWTSSQSAVATVSNSNANAGTLSTITAGTTDISATLNGIAVSTSIEVTDAVVTEISILPSQLTFAEGTSSRFMAIGILSNGNTQDITQLVNWSSDNENIITVSNIDKGLVTSSQMGEATLSASFNNLTSSASVNVSSATLSAIEVSPQNSQIANNTKLTLTATGIYSNGTHQDITRDVLWQSDAPDIVFVSNAGTKKGYAYSLSTGSATISATLDEVNGSTSITVNAKTLQSIAITTTGAGTITVGDQQQLIATATYSDGSLLDISNQVTWQSSNQNTCIISTAEHNYGLLKAKTAGTCFVTAKIEDISSSFIIDIGEATLQSISVSPVNITLAKGTQISLTATGHYSDNSTKDLSLQVSWLSNNNLTSISNTNTLQAVDVGDSIITARYNDISATTTITVSEAALISIAISSPDNGDFIPGMTKNLIATGTFSDQSTQDISRQVIWQSSNETVATISNASNTAGQLSAVTSGNTTVSASLGSISSNNFSVNVVDNPLAPVSISLQATPYIIFNDGTDASQVSINIQAADSAQTVTDGTEIQLTVTQGSGNLSSTTLLSVDGAASFSVTSIDKGLVTINATVTGTNISNTVSIYVTDDFSEVIGKKAYANGTLNSDGNVEVGSSFGFLLLNFANRAFIIDKFVAFNNNAIIEETSDPSVLNNNELAAGGNVLVVYLTADVVSNAVGVAYYLTEPVTGEQFVIAVGYQLQ